MSGVRNWIYWLSLRSTAPTVVATQETKIDSSVATSEFFSETCHYNVPRKNRSLHVGGVMILIHKDILHMTLPGENYLQIYNKLVSPA